MNFHFFERLDEMPADLDALWQREAGDSVFLSRWWFETVLGAGLDGGDRPAIGVLRAEDGSARGIVPARFVTRAVGPLRFRQLQGLTGMYCCYFRPLLAAADDGAAAEALGTALGRAMGRSGILRFDALDADWPALRAFEAGLAAAGLKVERYQHFGNWSEDLDGRSFEDYLRARDGALREIIRRKGRALERQGRIAYQILSRADEVEEGLSFYEEVYRRSWKVPEPYPAFQPLLCRKAAAAGALRLGICRIDGTPAAAQLWILWRGTATVLKLAHDEQVKSLSVGTLLTAHMIRHLVAEEGATRLDFGRGDDAYKSRWTMHRRQRIGIVAANPRSAAGLAAVARQLAGRWRRKYWPKR